VLDELRIESVDEIDVEVIAAHYGAITRYRSLRNEQGHLVRRGDTAVIVVDDALRGGTRARWVVSHELGHFLLHGGHDQYASCTAADLRDYRQSGREPEANHFAGELLMPERFFAPECDRSRPSLKDVRELADRFATSLTATALRFAKFSPEPCAMVISEAGKVRFVAASKTWRFFIAIGHILTDSTYAGDVFGGRVPPPAPLRVDASAWSTCGWTADRDIVEHTVALGTTGWVLSVLWDPGE
jgi:Zn-dependent peptidase ImmA (M78 family)